MIKEILESFIRHKKKILVYILIGTLISCFTAFSSQDKYTSSVLLAPTDNSNIDQSASQLLNFGGLGSFIGMNAGSAKTNLAVEILTSQSFISDFINNRDILIELFAANKWDSETRTLLIDNDIYNEETNSWARDVNPPYSSTPNTQEAYRIWIDDHMKVSIDAKTQFVSIELTYISPEHAQRWLYWLVEDLNNRIRDKDINQSERALKYLNSELEKTTSDELKSLLYRLIEQQTKIIMLANTNQFYVLEIIDHPVIPYIKSSPFRLVIILSGFMASIFSSLLLFYIYDFLRKEL